MIKVMLDTNICIYISGNDLSTEKMTRHASCIHFYSHNEKNRANSAPCGTALEANRVINRPSYGA